MTTITHVYGSPSITEPNKHRYANLTSVEGDLYVHADFSAPNLISVEGRLVVDADFSAPNLRSVGDSLDVRADFSAPNLRSVEGEQLTKPPVYKFNLRWPVLITDRYMRIGCQRHTHAQWAKLSDEKIKLMDDDALEFWTEHKAELLGLCAKHAKTC